MKLKLFVFYFWKGCWIIGDALDRGVGKIAGEAVAEYVEAYGGDKMLAIGVTPMNNLKFKHIFNTNASVSNP